MRVRTIAACALGAPLLIAASEPVRLQPSSKWVVDYGENSCRLIRTFGEGASKTVLLMESEVPYEIDMLVVGQPLRTSAEEVIATFDPVGGKPLLGQTAKSAKDGTAAVVWSRVSFLPDHMIDQAEARFAALKVEPGVRPPQIDLAQRELERSERKKFVAEVSAIRVDVGRKKSVVLETGSLDAAVRTLDQCGQESLKGGRPQD